MTPSLIGLCGYPQCGKSTVTRVLQMRYNTIPVDDSWPLRDFCIRHLGATLEDVTTQAGKARTTVICGETIPWRAVMGRIGDQLEALYGDAFLPECALRRCTDRSRTYTFGSVRKTQGVFLKRQSTLVVEIVRNGCKPSAPFDEYDRSCVDFTIPNHDGLSPFIADVVRRFDGLLPVVNNLSVEAIVAEISRQEKAALAVLAA